MVDVVTVIKDDNIWFLNLKHIISILIIYYKSSMLNKYTEAYKLIKQNFNYLFFCLFYSSIKRNREINLEK